MNLSKTQKSLQILAGSYQKLVDAWRDLWLDAQAADTRARAEKAEAAFKGNDVETSPSKVAELIAVIAGGYDSPRRLGHLAYHHSTQVPLGELCVTFSAHRTDVPKTSTLKVNWANHPSLNVVGDCALEATQGPDGQQVLTLSRLDDKPVIKIDDEGVHLEGDCVEHRQVARTLANLKHGVNAAHGLMDEIRKKLDIPKS